MKKLGLYLHIPFCKSKCLYCDFCSFPRPSDELLMRYTDVLCRDIETWAERCRDRTVDTVYFGGGTPTLLPPRMLEKILTIITRHYRVDTSAEITAECNPATGGKEAFRQMRRAGFNRLSIGLQSVHANELKALGRLHNFLDVFRTWEDARAASFDNLSVDLMSGIPHQTLDSWLETLEKVCTLSPEHISSYGLIIEDGTPFANREATLPLPDEDATERMYFDAIRYLEERGWEQYEISNFARPGYESRHNLKYWNCDEYLGFGPAAYSDFNGTRFGNSRDLDAYISGKDITAEREAPSLDERANEYVMLRMRLCDGIRITDFESRFGTSFADSFGRALARYVDTGFVKRTSHGYAFTSRGMYVSNAILSDILDFSSKSEKTY